jgi:hypothetical protein
MQIFRCRGFIPFKSNGAVVQIGCNAGRFSPDHIFSEGTLRHARLMATIHLQHTSPQNDQLQQPVERRSGGRTRGMEERCSAGCTREYGLVLEGGPELSGSSESSDDEELTNMYAPGCESIDMARLTEVQARILHARGRAGGQGTVSGTGSKAPTQALFE